MRLLQQCLPAQLSAELYPGAKLEEPTNLWPLPYRCGNLKGKEDDYTSEKAAWSPWGYLVLAFSMGVQLTFPHSVDCCFRCHWEHLTSGKGWWRNKWWGYLVLSVLSCGCYSVHSHKLECTCRKMSLMWHLPYRSVHEANTFFFQREREKDLPSIHMLVYFPNSCSWPGHSQKPAIQWVFQMCHGAAGTWTISCFLLGSAWAGFETGFEPRYYGWWDVGVPSGICQLSVLWQCGIRHQPRLL